MPIIESAFQKMLNDTNYFDYCYYSGLHFPLYKYTMELIYDGHLLPNKYIIVENRMLHQYPKIYKLLVRRGDITLVKKMLKLNRNRFIYENGQNVMRTAAEVGNIDLLRWMIKKKYFRDKRATAYAAKYNQLKTLKWLIDHKFDIGEYAIGYAAGGGHDDIVHFLIDKECDVDYYYPASKGNFEMVKYLCMIDPEYVYGVCDGAIESGNLDILKFAYENGDKFDCDYIPCAHPHILHWLIDNEHILPNIETSIAVAWAGNLECLQLLHHHKFPILDKQVFTEAVHSRNIEMIEWLHKLGCPFDRKTTSAAVKPPMTKYFTGSLPILKKLVEWGCELKDTICETAAYHGDLEILQYLFAVGCKLTDKIVESAAKNGHLPIIIWAREKGCKWGNACRAAVEWNHLNILKWLRRIDRDVCGLKSNEKGICRWDEDVCYLAINYCYVDILEFALENGCKFSNRCYQYALESGNNSIIACVKKHYSPKNKK